MLNFILIYVTEWWLRGLDLHKLKYAGQLPWSSERNISNDKRYMHKGTFRSVYATIFAVEKQ